MTGTRGLILIVDDNETNRDLLSRRLSRLGHDTLMAEHGQQALDCVTQHSFDLILLDIMMPNMTGYEVLERLKADPDQRHIPVIMVSALDDIDSVVRCIELGAEDYLFKPFNPVLLKARVTASLEKKRIFDYERAMMEKLRAEQEKSERLLLNILPGAIADRLKQGEQVIADNFSDVTVLFADLVNFTELSAQLSPPDLVALLNQIFSTFDQLADRYGLEKIKTIGDAYLVVGGLPTPRPDHVEAVAEMALAMQQAIAQFRVSPSLPTLTMRIGINTGPVGAGVIGTKKFAYDLWGDTVNTASRMESSGLPGHIQVTTEVYERLKNKYHLDRRGAIEVKGKGEMMTYFLRG
jgi:adenylate cyclase